MFNLRQLAALAVIYSTSPSYATSSLKPNRDVAKDRAPQIFNAVHDSMRQWGSSLHHNGVSFFLATVPEGVLFYHGNNRSESPTEPDWLAYEIEHAEQFARPRGPPRSRRNSRAERREPFHINPVDTETQQHILNPLKEKPEAPESGEQKGGYLHVYKTTRDLPFLYIDGMSGGKTEMGTLDSQDFLLRNRSREDTEPDKPHRGPMGEGSRARELCELSTSWGLQGVIRMEAGFEIIKCDFKDGLEEIQTLQRPSRSSDRPGHPPGYGPGGDGPDGPGKGHDEPNRDGPDGPRHRPGHGPDGPRKRPDFPWHWPGHGPDGPDSDGPGGPGRDRPDGPGRWPGHGPDGPGKRPDRPWHRPGHGPDGPDRDGPDGPRHQPEDGSDGPGKHPDGPKHWPGKGPKPEHPPRHPEDGPEYPPPRGPKPWPGHSPRSPEDGSEYPPPHPPPKGPKPWFGHRPRRLEDGREHPPPPPRGPKPWFGRRPRHSGYGSEYQPEKGPGYGPGHGPGGPPGGSIASFEFLRGVSNRYDGIGSSRTILDYSSMVSAFFFPVNLTNPDPKRPDLPRLSNLSDDELKHIKGAVENAVKARLDGSRPTIKWQDTADLIVKRYAERIQFMAQKGTSPKQIADEANFLLDTFIDYSDEGKSQDNSASIARCRNLYLATITPKTEADELIHAAFEEVLSQICTTLFKVRDISPSVDQHKDEAFPAAVDSLKSLLNYLGWASFKRCPPCGVDEVCLIPMWPFGTVEAYEHPQCVKSTEGRGNGESYWGDRFGPPPPKYE